MNPSRWKEVEEIYQSAVDLEPASRGAFLAEVCKGDAELRREVEALVESENLPLLIDQPAWNVAPELLDDDAELEPGSELGPYRIDEVIGAGGMGKVYRATDTRLDRSVALKLSRIEFSERFEREARAIASLNHPNICILYDVGHNYLVMELVEGVTLLHRIQEGSVPLDDALEISRQIIGALAAAHERGIVHRDLKPGNIKIKPDGSVKVLDFGLAKLGATPTVHMEDSPTIRTMPTEAGMILGTAAYVSPEQARGKPVDRRADIWAFGVVLYEMLTGRQLFGRDTVSDTLAAVLKEEPQWDHVPVKAQSLLRSCLQKNPDHRLRDIGDAPLLLEDVTATIPTRRPWFAWASAVLLFAVAASLAFVHFRETSPAPAHPVRFGVQLPGTTDPPSFAISPDGRRLAFVAAGTDGLKRLWIRSLDAIEAKTVPGSETSRSGIRHVPFWSPDSRYVAFDAGGKLKKVDVATGSVHTVCSVPGDIAGGSWNKHDVIIFGIDAPGHGIMRVSAASGEPKVVISNADFARPGVRFLFPTFLPDGEHFLYRQIGLPDGIYVGSLEAKPQQRETTPLVRSDAGFFSYVSLPDSVAGQLLFTREGTLLAQKFDAETLQLTGDAVSIVEDVFPDETNVPRGLFSVSAADVLVYAGGDRGRQWTWVDRQGNVVENLGQAGQMVALSRDATKLAFTRFVGRLDNPVWLMDLATRQVSQLTFNSGVHQNPVWSWDASRVAFVFYQPDGSGFSVYQTLSSGTGHEEPLVQPKTSLPTDWSRDYLLYQRRDSKTKADVWVRQLESGKEVPLVATEADETRGRFSPDGRTIAYVSDEGGRNEIWVAPFGVSSAGVPIVVGGKRKISSNGGTRVLWRHDGKELFYLSPDGTIMAVDVTPGSTFPYGNPHPLFQTTSGPWEWDVAPDGQRFIVSTSLDSPASPAVVVLNWTGLLKN